MLIDSKSILKYRLYETGQISCTLSGSGNKKAKGGRVLGKKQKKFNIDKKIVRSTIIRQFNLKKNTIKFFTLTFPKDITNEYANECFSKFVENCKENYNLHSYCACKELTKIGRPHYHCFFDMPYVNYSRLNRAWCHTFFPIMPYSPNALQTRKGKSIIKTIKRACNYASKYVTKVDDYIFNPEYELVTMEQFNNYVQNRMFFCDNFIKSNGYVISNGLIDYLNSINGLILKCDKDYFQIYFLYHFTPSLEMMQKYVRNYAFFVVYLKIKRSFILLLYCLFIVFYCLFMKFIENLLTNTIIKDNFVFYY